MAVISATIRRLHGAVAAVDDEHLGLNAGDRLQRGADLVGMLHLIVEDVAMLVAEAADPRKQ